VAKPGVEKRKRQSDVRAVEGGKDKKWQRAVEKHAGDPDLQAVFSTAMKLREADRKRARNNRQKRSKHE
jgi:hypothetical protein